MATTFFTESPEEDAALDWFRSLRDLVENGPRTVLGEHTEPTRTRHRSVPAGAAGSATGGDGPVPGDTLTIHRWDESTRPGRVEIGILSGGTEAESRSGRSLAVYPDTARRFGRLLDSRGFPLLPGERPSARLARLDRNGDLFDFLESVSGEHPPDSELGDLLRVLREALRPAGP